MYYFHPFFLFLNLLIFLYLLPNYSIKPWESRVLDTKEVWNFNSFTGLSSLNLVCTSLGLETSKEGEVNGSNMHKYYYDNNNIEKIKNYCEEDVKCTINLVKKLKNYRKKFPVGSDFILGVNIGPNKDSNDRFNDYEILSKNLSEFADYLTINISSPEGMQFDRGYLSPY